MKRTTRITRTIDLKLLLTLYDCLLRDPSIEKAALALEIPKETIWTWFNTNPDVKLVRQLADEKRGNAEDFKRYILGKLTPEAKKIWDKVSFFMEADDGFTPELMKDVATNIRKEIFLQALASGNWHVSRACRIAGVSRQTMLGWQTDPEFKGLMGELHEAKKDFFENALLDLIECRYPGAVLFANRTQNADRGYNEKIQLEHTGVVNHSALNIEELNLDIETRRKILDAIREKNQEKVLPSAIDVKQIPEKVTNEEDEEWDEVLKVSRG